MLKEILKTSLLSAVTVANIYAQEVNISTGWNNIGTDSGFDSMDSFDKSCIDLVWKYNKSTDNWSAYSPQIVKANLIAKNSSIFSLNSVGQNEAVWILANSNCNVGSKISISSTTTNII